MGWSSPSIVNRVPPMTSDLEEPLRSAARSAKQTNAEQQPSSDILAMGF